MSLYALNLFDLADNDAVIEVEDRGPGVRPSERGRIFERFVRGSAAAGKGLSGLALWRNLMSWTARSSVLNPLPVPYQTSAVQPSAVSNASTSVATSTSLVNRSRLTRVSATLTVMRSFGGEMTASAIARTGSPPTVES